MSKKGVIYVIVVIALLVALIITIVVWNKPASDVLVQKPNESPTSSPTISVPDIKKPISPSNLIAESTSSHTIELRWQDNANNEDGFKLYRNNSVIANLGPNTSIYQDINLESSTVYCYTIKAYNSAGESGESNYQIKTPNPSITIKLDRIGVYDNREDWSRGEDGEVYIFVAVYDGKSPEQLLRFPKVKEQHYKLSKNETIDISSVIFSANEVGDNLGLTILGYEDDGEGFEPLVYQAMGLALEQQLANITWGLTALFDINLSGLIGDFMGKADDFLGSFEGSWSIDNNWGIGSYTDIACVDERGTECLRLWFTIEGE